ncbi:unnamed protein product [Pseudo-nitzschia multistriata]|uniref:Transmembrane protein n=1 Tax=Pseudo-nitzschia multistriata TaxID=183589 RepID=A0A448ZPA8_9STRA|nr:unnamed protein product [Pseudo-nitzschia multistriata]
MEQTLPFRRERGTFHAAGDLPCFTDSNSSDHTEAEVTASGNATLHIGMTRTGNEKFTRSSWCSKGHSPRTNGSGRTNRTGPDDCRIVFSGASSGGGPRRGHARRTRKRSGQPLQPRKNDPLHGSKSHSNSISSGIASDTFYGSRPPLLHCLLPCSDGGSGCCSCGSCSNRRWRRTSMVHFPLGFGQSVGERDDETPSVVIQGPHKTRTVTRQPAERTATTTLRRRRTRANRRTQHFRRCDPEVCRLVLVAVAICCCWWLPSSALAKIRVPSVFGSNGPDSDEGSPGQPPGVGARRGSNGGGGDTEVVTPKTGQEEPEASSYSEAAAPLDFEAVFNQWLRQNWSDEPEPPPPPLAATDSKTKAGSGPRPPFVAAFAASRTEPYLSRLGDRLEKIRRFRVGSARAASDFLRTASGAASDLLRYDFPVGLVAVWSVMGVLRRVAGGKKGGAKGRRAGGKGTTSTETGAEEEDNLDTYKYILRHTGRALDLDSDDLVSYRYHGGIERVRSRLLRSVLRGELEGLRARSSSGDGGEAAKGGLFSQRQRHSSGTGDERQNNSEDEHDTEQKLLEALLEALSLEFIPGGSHSNYIRRMIPSVSNAEELAGRMGITGSDSETDTEPDRLLLAIALQTAEVRILDSQLRSVRDRLVRTTYRLHKTVNYWKSKVESTLLLASSPGGLGALANGISSAHKGDLLPLPRLRRRWSRFLFSLGSSSFGSKHHNRGHGHGTGTQQQQNSLLEGDRLRLAFAEAAYKAEIVRLGRVLRCISNRPDEMPDSTLTTALIDQKQRKEAEKQSRQDAVSALSSNSSSENELETAFGEREATNGKKQPIRVRVAAARERLANRLVQTKAPRNNQQPDMNKQHHVAKMAGAFASVVSSSFLRPLGAATSAVMGALNKTKKRSRSKRFDKYFAIRFNADGRGKFSVQNFDEGSVTIEGETARNTLLYNTDCDCDQQNWLGQADAWSLEARGLIVDTIQETVEASIPASSGMGSPFLGSSTRSESSGAELTKLETEWQVRHQGTPVGEGGGGGANQRQWMIVYELSRDINRLRRVGEGKSLKFKWKEVHWIHWLRQWNLMGVPSAALNIAAAIWIRDKLRPYIPRVWAVAREVQGAVLEIFTTRFWTPLRDLVDEIMNRRKGLVTGVSLAEEEASLDTMLHDLGLGDGTPATRHGATIEATRMYESYMRSGLVWHALGGQLVRLMLIQMQQLKVSMLDAAETIDVLFQSNRINMQLLAVVPAIGIVVVGTKILVRFLFSVRAKEFRPMVSVHADMTDYLNKLETNIILRTSDDNYQLRSYPGRGLSQREKTNTSAAPAAPAASSNRVPESTEETQLGEFALTLYKYLLLLDYSSPQLLPSRQCDAIHESLTAFLGRKGSFRRDNLSTNGQIRLIDLVKGKHQDLSKFL